MRTFESRGLQSISFRNFAVLSLLLSVSLSTIAQNTGRPFITNYSYQEYNAGGVNWWTEQDDRGVLYFANSRGILEFDGVNWRVIPPKENNEVRSLAKWNGVIYVGTNGDLGYLAPDALGQMQFKSLRDRLPKDRQVFDEVWETWSAPHGVYFQTRRSVMLWDGEGFTLVEDPDGNDLHISRYIHGKFYIRVWNKGMMVVENDEFRMLPGGERFADERVYQLLPYDNGQLLIGTRNMGFFIFDGSGFKPFTTEVDQEFFEGSIYLGGQRLANGNFAVNTFNNGLYIINKNGDLVQRIDNQVGLQDNSVDHVFVDKDGNVWLALFNGISKLDLNIPFSYYDDNDGLTSKTVFSAARHEGILYVGTQDGVYYLDESTNRFNRIPNTHGQCPHLLVYGKDLIYASGSQGVWGLRNKKSYPIRESINYDFRSQFFVPSTVDSTLLYTILQDMGGIAALRYFDDNQEGSRWVVEANVDGIRTGPFGIAERSDGKLWVNGDLPGEMKLVTPQVKNGKIDFSDPEITIYNQSHGLPNYPIFVFNYLDKIYFRPGGSISRSSDAYDDSYLFDEELQKFVLDTPYWTPFIGDDVTPTPTYDHKGRLWASAGDGLFVDLAVQDGSRQVIAEPFKILKNFPTWGIFPEVDANGQDIFWLCGPNGLVRFAGDIETPPTSGFAALIRTIKHSVDTLYYGGAGGVAQNAEFSNNQNTLVFAYGAPNFVIKDGLQFSTYLEGFDNNWSAWSPQSEREYINLPSGNYTFHVKSRNVYETESEEAVFQFSINPPWYATWWAYLLYALTLGGFIYFLVRYRTQQLRNQSIELERKVAQRTGEVMQQAEELATVNQVSQAMVERLELDELVPLVGDQLRDLFKANIVYVAMLDKESNIIHFPYQHGDDMAPLKLGEGLTSKIIIDKAPKLINEDVTGSYHKLGIEEVGKKAASYLGVPIPVGDEVIGVLSVQSTENENRFDEGDQRLLSTIAANVGIAIHNAELYEEAKMAKDAAEQANEAKSAFLSTVSHELRTPLTSVLGFAKIIKKRLDDRIFPAVTTDDKKIRRAMDQVAENLNVVVAEGERLTGLINDVLDLAKIEAGKIDWHMESVSVPEVIDRAISSTKALFDQKDLQLINQIDPLLPHIEGDKNKLIQVMVNLFSNAVKFTNKGSVKCRAEHEDDSIVVSVTDTGIGISEEDKASVFEKFKQVGDTLTDKPQGTGLGLPICREIVEHHGGKMWVESDLGNGSTFFFSIPVSKEVSEKMRPIQLDDLVKQLKVQIDYSAIGTNGEDRRILVVDDDSPIRSLLKQELTEYGYEVLEATNGREALDVVRNFRPDLIILDVMMPEMNGFDVAAVLKNDPQTLDIPIIILSIIQDEARGFRIGVDRYLTKPIDTDKLFLEVGALLQQGKSKKKVLVVDEDSSTMRTLAEVLHARGYKVAEANGDEVIEKAASIQPDIIMLNALMSKKQEMVKSLRFEKGMENVLFLLYQ